MKLRVGLVGLGNAWETRHAPALRAMSDRFEVRAVCEQVAHRADRAAHEFGAVAVDGYRVLAEREDIDAILMLSPQWYGPLPILAACEAGKAVYCGAALDLDLEEALRLKERVQESGIAFMAELPRRHAPATLRLKELIATRLGPPRLIFCHTRMPVDPLHPPKSGPVPNRPPAGPMQHLIELVDWCRYVAGQEPTSVLGLAHETEHGLFDNDYEMMSVDFSEPGRVGTGTVAQISCGHYMPATWHEAISFRPPGALQVACQNGVAFIDLPATLIWFDTAGRHQEPLETERPVGEQMLALFFRAVTSLVRKTSDLEDAYRAMSIVLAGRQSKREGRRVPIQF
ncbi:MAG: Gfo/Idh/MocA family oxidoreductase [Planctomycetia bacterium]|nr:Gfo/Idh/MocA family oxidoreductase [Planctomycetia bacterium]